MLHVSILALPKLADGEKWQIHGWKEGKVDLITIWFPVYYDVEDILWVYICDVECRKRPCCQKLYLGLIFHITGVYS